MLVGVMLGRSEARGCLVSPKWLGLGVLVAVACGVWITIADCLEVERTYYNVYFGRKGKAIPLEMQPDLMVLTQWKERLAFANSIPGRGISPEGYVWMKGVLSATPETFLMFQLAQNLALNGRPDDARAWLERICIMAPDKVVLNLAEQWESAREANATYRMVEWKRCEPRLISGAK